MTETVVGAPKPGQGVSPPTERAISVLELLGRHPEGQFSLAEICRSLGISRATGHAILHTLTARGWAVRDSETGWYAWGPAVAALGQPAEVHQHRADLQALAGSSGTQVSLARREGETLVVIDTVGECLTGPRIWRGMRTPFVAPIGRDYVAWSTPESQQKWLRATGTPGSGFLERMTLVLNEIARRGYVVERLSRQYVRVYTALRALSTDGEVDEITRQLTQAFADLAVIDVVGEELDGDDSYSIATISAPVRSPFGGVAMTVLVSVFATLGAAEVRAVGEGARGAADAIEARLARFSDLGDVASG